MDDGWDWLTHEMIFYGETWPQSISFNEINFDGWIKPLWLNETAYKLCHDSMTWIIYDCE
jgi:hypothetical protein